MNDRNGSSCSIPHLMNIILVTPKYMVNIAIAQLYKLFKTIKDIFSKGTIVSVTFKCFNLININLRKFR